MGKLFNIYFGDNLIAGDIEAENEEQALDEFKSEVWIEEKEADK